MFINYLITYLCTEQNDKALLIIKYYIMKKLALQICQYNGQRGTEKQIEKCIKSFEGSMVNMLQFCQDRINVFEVVENDGIDWNNLKRG